jgi:hypothetical protein
MTKFVRILSDKDKASALLSTCAALRGNIDDSRIFDVEPHSFSALPGSPFSYWASENELKLFSRLPNMSTLGGETKCGAGTLDDFRFLRIWWEISGSPKWVPFPKGGVFSPWYGEVPLNVSWNKSGQELKQFVQDKVGSASRKIQAQEFYFRRGITWPRRTTQLSFRFMNEGCIFADKGPAAFIEGDDKNVLFALCAMMNSSPFGRLVSLQLGTTDLARSFEVGIIQRTPFPNLSKKQIADLSSGARRAWSLKRSLYSVDENSRSFLLPEALQVRSKNYSSTTISAELADIQAEIDVLAFNLYGFNDLERFAALGSVGLTGDGPEIETTEADDNEDDDEAEAVNQADGLLSWAAGVAFGRFDWRLAIGEREAPTEPDPFDPLPAKSPGMLPDGAAQFHVHSGILLDDPGHQHDLPRVIEEVLARVQADVPGDVRRWLKRDFFDHHLKQYSKSRRKAPIYWPLSTSSGSYTLWTYYPSVTSQTLYTAVNDFVEPKLRQVSRDSATLRDKGSARSREDEKAFELLQTLELELVELRDTLQQIAQTYRPNHDDGVQITAAPLWNLFQNKPWQKILKDTWTKLEKGDYDWAHLAMAYWPDRVREKCKTDRSLAIAHDLEDLYVEPEPKPAKGKRKKKLADDSDD